MPRRAAILALLSLILGAMTTLGTCWSLACIRPNGSGGIPFSAPGFVLAAEGYAICGIEHHTLGHAIISLDGYTDSAHCQRLLELQLNGGISARAIESLPTWVRIPTRADSTPASQQHASTAFGWPALAMCGVYFELLMPSIGTPVAKLTYTENYYLFGDPADPGAIALPLGIIWPGFLINTLTYAAAWFLVLLAARRATRAILTRRRLHRGLCPACRYNLLGDFSTGCPECGWNRSTKQPS